MSCGLSLRIGRPEDLDAIVALDRATALLPHWSREEYAAALQGERKDDATVERTVLVAELSDGVAGFAVVKVARIAEDVSSELESIAVLAASHRNGIGRALCLQAIAWATGLGAAYMELEVRSRNEAAIALYTGLGFRAEGLRRRYYGNPEDDAVLMRRPL